MATWEETLREIKKSVYAGHASRTTRAKIKVRFELRKQLKHLPATLAQVALGKIPVPGFSLVAGKLAKAFNAQWRNHWIGKHLAYDPNDILEGAVAERVKADLAKANLKGQSQAPAQVTDNLTKLKAAIADCCEVGGRFYDDFEDPAVSAEDRIESAFRYAMAQGEVFYYLDKVRALVFGIDWVLQDFDNGYVTQLYATTMQMRAELEALGDSGATAGIMEV